jgi:hypothetical protein
MSVVYYVQHASYHRAFEVVRWENTEGKITKLIMQTSIPTRQKAQVACAWWREQEKDKGNGKD